MKADLQTITLTLQEGTAALLLICPLVRTRQQTLQTCTATTQACRGIGTWP